MNSQSAATRAECPFRQIVVLAVIGTVVGIALAQSLARRDGYDLLNGWAFFHGTFILVGVLLVALSIASVPRAGGLVIAFAFLAASIRWASSVSSLLTVSLFMMVVTYATFSVIRLRRR